MYISLDLLTSSGGMDGIGFLFKFSDEPLLLVAGEGYNWKHSQPFTFTVIHRVKVFSSLASS